jgi:AraC-like DNA-binding protein
MKEKIEQILARLAAPYRLDILWKGIGGFPSPALSPDYTLHCNDFCRAVKADPARLKKCCENDNRFLPVEALKHQAPFFRCCHAGVTELVVPSISAGQCAEAFLLGVFRETGASCPYPKLRPLYHAVPLRKRDHFTDAAFLLNDLLPVLRHYRESCREQDESIGDRRVLEAVRLLRRDFATRLTAGEIASRVCLSESRFLHLFKAQTGTSFTGFLLNVRLEHAAQWLKRTDRSIREIMESSGFNDQSYFCARFKQHTGHSPLSYRRKIAEPDDI